MGVPPSVTAQPQSQTVAAGKPCTLLVGATGVPSPTYQWFFNSARIARATNVSMTVSNFQSTNAGPYYVAVTNMFGAVTSETALLYLDWPLRFLNWRVNRNGLFESRVAGPAGSNFIIQGQVQGLPWSSITTNRATSGIIEFSDLMSFPDPSSSNGSSSTNRFYRAWLAP